MNYSRCGTLVLAALFMASSSILFASEPQSKTESFLHETDSHPYSQLFSVEAGTFRPRALGLSNSNYNYEYQGASLNSYLVEAGWGIKLFHLLGAFYLEEHLAFSSFKGSLPGTGDSLSLFMAGVDARLKHSWEWLPVRAVIPFVEGGYQYTFFTQSGPSDFESAQGTVGNFVAAGGVDLWLNAIFGVNQINIAKYNAIPVFLTAKVNRIFSKDTGINLDSTTFLAGLSIGI